MQNQVRTTEQGVVMSGVFNELEEKALDETAKAPLRIIMDEEGYKSLLRTAAWDDVRKKAKGEPLVQYTRHPVKLSNGKIIVTAKEIV